MNLIPTVIEKGNNGERAYDLYSKVLEDRIVFITGEIDDNTANIVVAELLYLDSLNHNDISIYINSKNNQQLATLQYIKNTVSYCILRL